MGGGLVSDSPPQESGATDVAPSFTSVFEAHFPYYLAIGMTPEQYWEGDPSLVRFYRKADKINKDRENQRLWLQGAYFYNALINASPILHAFAKRGTKPKPYPDKPYGIDEKSVSDNRGSREKAEFEKKKAIMTAWAAGINKRFANKEVKEDAGY